MKKDIYMKVPHLFVLFFLPTRVKDRKLTQLCESHKITSFQEVKVIQNLASFNFTEKRKWYKTRPHLDKRLFPSHMTHF